MSSISITIPTRIQRRRAAGWRQPDSTRYCGRGTRWGNDRRIGDIDPETKRTLTRDDVLLYFDVRIGGMIADMGLPLFVEFFLAPLVRYQHLSCFCKESDGCHVDMWIEYIRRYESEIREFMK
jgi:hypothetical protein